MIYNGSPLHKLKKDQLISLCEQLAAELRMVGSTVPGDIKVDDIADLLPPDDEDWQPPRIAAMLYKGIGKPGGR